VSTDTPRGFAARPGSRLLRSHVDLPEEDAVAVVALADAESARAGEPVSAQGALRLLVREALAARRGEGEMVPRTEEERSLLFLFRGLTTNQRATVFRAVEYLGATNDGPPRTIVLTPVPDEPPPETKRGVGS
jgi:hypothetical protein